METKRKYSKEFRIRICEQYISGRAGALELARANGLGKRGDVLVYRWVRQYRKSGPSAFDESGRRFYALEFKQRAVGEYLKGGRSLEETAIENGISSPETLRAWVLRYNNHVGMRTHTPKGDAYMANTLKTTFEERLTIVKYCLDHGRDIKGTAVHFGGSYSQVRYWVLRYEELGERGLEDKRGRRKADDELTDLEKAQRKIAALEEENELQRRTIELLKKRGLSEGRISRASESQAYQPEETAEAGNIRAREVSPR